MNATREKTPVMVNGLPGKMATEVARQIIRSNDFVLCGSAFTGDGQPEYCTVDGTRIHLYPASQREQLPLIFGGLPLGLPPSRMVVDATQPSAASSNAVFYCKNRMRFVMLTTGGDKEAVIRAVSNSGISAVMAPNMAKQIVAFQDVMERFATEYQGQMANCVLDIIESHQEGKKDTSGTAKAVLESFKQLGIENRNITMIRKPSMQESLGVPKDHLGGHGWHTYEITGHGPNRVLGVLHTTLWEFLNESTVFQYYIRSQNGLMPWEGAQIFRLSKGGDVAFEQKFVRVRNPFMGEPLQQLKVSHRVNGRAVYAEGTLDALMFLRGREERGKTYSMLDVINQK
jgi:4-hydroxy-tetrahydrodipicolinate reductase